MFYEFLKQKLFQCKKILHTLSKTQISMLIDEDLDVKLLVHRYHIWLPIWLVRNYRLHNKPFSVYYTNCRISCVEYFSQNSLNVYRFKVGKYLVQKIAAGLLSWNRIFTATRFFFQKLFISTADLISMHCIPLHNLIMHLSFTISYQYE